jgi:hypothetical protein
MKLAKLISLILLVILFSCKEKPQKFNGLNMNIGNLSRLSDAKSRSISPEHFTGEKGKGGMATLETGNAAKAARELGQGWKVNPYIYLNPGETVTLAEIEGEGAITHIWMTPVCDYRLTIFKIYWDNEESPSVEVPVGDFFAAGWGMGFEPKIRSLAVCVNPRSGFNCYWQMPFRKKCKIVMENLDTKKAGIYYQVDYTLTDVPDDEAYFHARFNRVHAVPEKEVYTIVDNIKGKGQYVGTYLAHGAYEQGWWGEGEIKFYIDGDKDFPTICGTGEEDYFSGSYGYDEVEDKNGVINYTEFSSPYSGFYYFKDNDTTSFATKVGEYRWHITDPIRFENDLKVTIQCLGWQSEGRYRTLQDDLASVAYWYQTEPHNPFPKFLNKEELIIKKENP